MIIAVVGAAIMMFLAIMQGSNPTDDIAKLTAQMETVGGVLDEGRKNARNPNLLKSANDAGILLNSDKLALEKVTAGATAKADKTIVPAEKARAKELVAKLKKAAIDGQFDRKFVPVITEELTSLKSQLALVNKRSSSPDIKSATLTTHKRVTELIKTFSEFPAY